MSSSDSTVPITTAAELWQYLIDKKVFHPKTYDDDIVALLETQLPGSGPLPGRMQDAEWTAQDWLRAMSPAVDSFAGLMRDLLALYTDIAATQATTENLVISYEFEQGNAFDQSLAQFQDAVTRVNRAQAARGSLVIPAQQSYFLSLVSDWSAIKSDPRSLRNGDDDWGFTLPAPPETGDPAVARGVSLVYAILTAACNTLRGYGATMHAAYNNPLLHDPDKNELAMKHQNLYFAFTDYFPEVVISQLQVDVEHLSSRPFNEVNEWLRKIEDWCSSFWKTESNDAESALDSVLSLPMWGKRHELYSAWVVCVIATAFKRQKLQFEVVNGRLSFPFRRTKIASFEAKNGHVDLWSEVRSEASGELSHGRKHGVQPDYRFLRPGQEPSDTDLAIEVKQYRRAAASRHGDTARDYARALRRAKVSIVAHGPIGRTAANRVDESDQDRVTFHENIRSLTSTESTEFVNELREVFPPAVHVQDIKVEESCVNEAEIQVITRQHASDTGTILHRGAHVQTLGPLSEGEIVLEIVCHPERQHTIDRADLIVAVTFSDGKVKRLKALVPNRSTSWHVGSICNSSFVLSAETVESAY